MSSDPVMNWMNIELDSFAIVSNSDAHSLENFAREANIFDYVGKDFEKYVFDYKDIERALKQKKYDSKKIDDLELAYLQGLFEECAKLKL
ncbi:MAG: hypothetical protein ACOZBL_05295 [Patescibacteria group bacterium]